MKFIESIIYCCNELELYDALGFDAVKGIGKARKLKMAVTNV